jgi:hypothetical protein
VSKLQLLLGAHRYAPFHCPRLSSRCRICRPSGLSELIRLKANWLVVRPDGLNGWLYDICDTQLCPHSASVHWQYKSDVSRLRRCVLVIRPSAPHSRQNTRILPPASTTTPRDYNRLRGGHTAVASSRLRLKLTCSLDGKPAPLMASATSSHIGITSLRA